MTFSTAQNMAAKEQGYINWNHACTTGEIETLDYLNTVAMSIYKKNRKPHEIAAEDKVYHKRMIAVLITCFVISGLIWALIIMGLNWWNKPVTGERDFSGYGAHEGRRFNSD